MKSVTVFMVFFCFLAITKAKPVNEDQEFVEKREDKSSVEDELENSGNSDEEDEEDGSTIDEEPRAREKRGIFETDKEEQNSKDFSGEKEGTENSSGDEEMQKDKLQWKNSMGIRGPFTITALQPMGLQNPSSRKQNDQGSVDLMSTPGNIQITPLEPKINSMKKIRRRCLCPFPCGVPNDF